MTPDTGIPFDTLTKLFHVILTPWPILCFRLHPPWEPSHHINNSSRSKKQAYDLGPSFRMILVPPRHYVRPRNRRLLQL